MRRTSLHAREIVAAACTVALLATTVSCTATRSRSVADDQRGATVLGNRAHVPGHLYAVGANDSGQLGDGSTTSSGRFVAVVSPRPPAKLGNVVAVDGGRAHSVALLANGEVLAWGDNSSGQLGVSDRRRSLTPVYVRAPDGQQGTLENAVAVAADSDFSMALLRDGTIVTWGKADVGQRGTGRLTAPITPTRVLSPTGKGPLTHVTAIDSDGRTEVALLDDGSVVTWGDNGHGQLGDGTFDDRSLPVFVRGLYSSPRLTSVVAVAVGGQHTLAVLDDGRVASWGSNAHGQLGDSTLLNRPYPDLVIGVGGHGFLRGVATVSAGELDSLALLRNGTCVGWGDDSAGQLGNGQRASYQPFPTYIVQETSHLPVTHLAAVEAGEGFSAGITDSGIVLTWGAGSRGQLGSPVQARTRPGRALLDAAPRAHAVALGLGMQALLVVVVP